MCCLSRSCVLSTPCIWLFGGHDQIYEFGTLGYKIISSVEFIFRLYTISMPHYGIPCVECY